VLLACLEVVTFHVISVVSCDRFLIGMQMYQQSLELAAGTDLIVATPGRLLYVF
jgi:superfamily II DNA/RNA helicase